MPLSADPVSRVLKHTRSVGFEGYARADGLSDIDAHLTERLGSFSSAAVQVLADTQRDTHDDGRKPFRLDRCPALETGTD